jgi:hypothetical protein
MRIFPTFLVVLFFICPAVGEETAVRQVDGPGFSINLPPGWIPVKSSEMEMIIQHEANKDTRLSILRFEIDKNNRLESRYDILEAIKGLYRQLGFDSIACENINLALAEDLAFFQTDYREADLSDSDRVNISLNGLIVRSQEEVQIFFLLRGYIPDDIDQAVAADLEDIMKSFTITLPISDSLFPTGSRYGLIILFFALALMAFFYMRNRKVQKSRNPLGGDSQFFWRCPDCRLANHIEHNRCQRCGAERTEAEKIR